ncbi:MAG: macro domain-containing protein [Clostridia bacterium]|nr:macro domain-containing protein [Clostridia bacterium]
MPFTFVHGDITEMEADAIVNAANPSLLGGGGVDGAIHRAAGPELRKECAGLGGCVPGEAKRTAAYNLRAKYVIHTVGPVWEGGGHGEAEILASCYRNSLKLAAESGCASVIFPLISAGAYGFPKRVALTVAEEAIGAFLADGHDEMDVRLALYDPPYTLRAEYRELIRDLGRRSSPAVPVSASRPAPVPGRKKSSRQEKADKSGEREKQAAGNSREPAPSHFLSALSLRKDAAGYPFDGGVSAEGAADSAAAPPDISLEQALSMIDESFSEMLLRKIDERGMKDSECYRRANVDRKLFSKIRSDPHYRPSKTTAIAFAVALELSIEETEELLLKAGYALSPSAPFDVIVRFFIERGNYDIFSINEALYAFNQKQLGA